MINKGTIQNIIETARIEEVTDDYVVLKKRGVNLLGLGQKHQKTEFLEMAETACLTLSFSEESNITS